MDPKQETKLAEAISVHPGFLHFLHLVDAQTHTTSFELPSGSPFPDTVLLFRPSNTSSQESPCLPTRRGMYAARGTIVHIRRASRQTTFVDIDLAAGGSRKADTNAAEASVSDGSSEVCNDSIQPPDNINSLALKQPDVSQSDEPGACAEQIEAVRSQEAASNKQSGLEESRSGLFKVDQATPDQSTPKPAIRDTATPECSGCSRLELMIPGSLLASLPQKLRIGSLVECWGDCLENLSAVRADPQHSGPTCRSSDGETQVQDVAAAKNGIGGVTDEPIQNAKFEELGERRCALSNGAASREGAHHLEISPSLQEGGSSSSLKTRCKGSSLTGKVIPDVDWMLQVSSLNVFDPRGSASGNEFLYKHLAAKSELPSVCRGGRSAQAKPGVCKYWVNEGRCARGVDCPYEHPPHGEPLKKARAGYLAAKASGNHALGNAGKAKRAQVFGDWVKETYERGNPDLRVVDVAAGAHGELAFHLAEHGIFCTSVEPRERKLTKAQRKALAEKGVRLPKESTPPALPQSLVGAHRRELFADDKFWTDVVRKEADILVGLHPDQVTEAIVDVALRAGVPFAVVPCCVFPKLFPDRRIGDGRPVITYEDFVEYLQRKGKAHGKVVEKATLKFAGSNTVLFTRT